MAINTKMCRLLSVFIAAMFLANCFVVISQTGSADGAEEQAAAAGNEDLKDIKVNISVFNDMDGRISDGKEQAKELSYVFEDIPNIELVTEQEKLTINTSGKTLVEVVPYDVSGSLMFVGWGFEDEKRPIIGQKVIWDDEVNINLVLAERCQPAGAEVLGKVIMEKGIATGGYVALDTDYYEETPRDLNLTELCQKSGLKKYTIDLCGHSIKNIRFILTSGVEGITLAVNDSVGYGYIASGNSVCIIDEKSGMSSFVLNGGNLIVNGMEPAITLNAGKFTMNGGAISGTTGIIAGKGEIAPRTISINGGVIDCSFRLIEGSGVDFTMTGGKLTGVVEKKDTYGAVFLISSNLILAGGEISDCRTTAIHVEPMNQYLPLITLTGTVIANNDAGMFIGDGSLYMSGGEIINNGSSTQTLNGAGISALGNSHVYISGGIISGNYCCGSNAAFFITDGSEMYLSGTPVIRDNYIDNKGEKIPSNIEAQSDEKDVRTTVNAKFGDGASIFVSIPPLKSNDESIAVKNAVEGYDPSMYFHCDTPDHMCVNKEVPGGSLVMVTPVGAEDHGCGENLTWELEGDTLIITGDGTTLKAGTYWTNIVVKQVNYIEIPEGVQNISAGTFFNFSNLKEITIPGTVVSIGNAAFMGNSSVEKIVFEGSEVKLDKDAFNFTEQNSNRAKTVTVVSEGNWAEEAFTEDVVGAGNLQNFVFEGGEPEPGPEPEPVVTTDSGSNFLFWLILIAAVIGVLIAVNAKR